MNGTPNTALDSELSPLVWFRCSRWLGLVSLLLLLAGSMFHSLTTPLDISLDCALLLQCGQMLIEGQRLYVDIVEINPPMIMYLSMIPAGLAKFLAAHQVTCFITCVWALTVLSAVLSVRILDGVIKDRDKAYVPALIVALGLADWVMSPNIFFGEREHIGVLLIMPFFLLRCVRRNNGSTSNFFALTAGIFAGIGCCIKPYFLLLPALAEVFWLGRAGAIKNLLKVENYGAILVGIAYCVHFLFLPAESRHNYFDVLIPLAVKGYQAYNKDFVSVLLLDQVPLVKPSFLIPLLALALFLRKQCSFLMPFFAWTVAGYFVFVLQQKGFPYHSIPMRYGMVLLSISELMTVFLMLQAKLLPARPEKPGANVVTLVFGTLALASLIVCGVMVGKFIDAGKHNFYLNDRYYTPCEALVIGCSNPGDAVFFFNAGGGHQYPLLVQIDRRPGSRFMDMSPFSMVKFVQANAKDDEERKKAVVLEHEILTQLAADFETRKTKLVMIPDRDWALPEDFSVYRYLAQQGFIKTALRNYKAIASTCNYHVYQRIADKNP